MLAAVNEYANSAKDLHAALEKKLGEIQRGLEEQIKKTPLDATLLIGKMEKKVISNIDNLTIREAKELAGLFGNIAKTPSASPSRIEGDGRAVIVRARDAGVHYGKLVGYEGRTVWLTDSRRLWSWTANSGIALSGVAMSGVNKSKSKIDASVPSIVILDACEIIDCAPDAVESIEAA